MDGAAEAAIHIKHVNFSCGAQISPKVIIRIKNDAKYKRSPRSLFRMGKIVVKTLGNRYPSCVRPVDQNVSKDFNPYCLEVSKRVAIEFYG